VYFQRQNAKIAQDTHNFINTPISMTSQPYHIHNFNNGSLSAMAMPSTVNLQQDLQALKAGGTDKILCLLEESEATQLGLQQQESHTIDAGIEFQRFPIADYGVPEFLDLQVQITRARKDLDAGINLLVHCRGGIGRTGLICCCLMLTTGISVPDAISVVTKQRGKQVPETPEQIDMLIRYAARNRNI